MTDRNAIKLYEQAMKELPSTIDCQTKNLKSFLADTQARSFKYGWDAIMSLPLDGDENNLHSLFTS
jgi:hypothetical protein